MARKTQNSSTGGGTRLTGKAQDRLSDRLTRQADALRANLQRRKAQLRARQETASSDDNRTGAEPGDDHA